MVARGDEGFVSLQRGGEHEVLELESGVRWHRLTAGPYPGVEFLHEREKVSARHRLHQVIATLMTAHLDVEKAPVFMPHLKVEAGEVRLDVIHVPGQTNHPIR